MDNGNDGPGPGRGDRARGSQLKVTLTTEVHVVAWKTPLMKTMVSE